MRFFFVGILFFGAVGLFAWVARYSHKESVEEELTKVSKQVLTEAGFADVTVSFDHMVGTLGGFVDSVEKRQEVVPLLESSVPGAYFPTVEECGVEIRPTLQPWVRMVKAPNSLTAKLEGSISVKEETHKRLLGARLHSVSGGNAIANEIEFDARRLPLVHVAEYASLAAGLISSTESSELLLKDGTLTIKGEVENAGIKFGLMEIAKSISGTSIVDELNVKATPIFKNPSEMKLSKTRFGVTLEGTVPDQAARDQIQNAFAAVDGMPRLNGQLEVDPALDDPFWMNNALQLIPLFALNMEDGAEAHYSGDRVLVRGKVKDEEHHEEILKLLGDLAQKEAELDVVAEVSLITEIPSEKVSPEIAAVYENGELTLTGMMPSDDEVVSLLLGISSSHPELKINNQIKVVVLAITEDWLEKLGPFLAEVVSRTESGKTEIRDGKVMLSGQAVSADETRFLHNLAVNTVPTSFTILNTLKFEEPVVPMEALDPEIAAKLTAELNLLPVYFDVGSDSPGDQEKEKLEKIVAAIRETGVNFPIVVGGLSDTLGDPEKNKELSIRRANSVRDALIALGISEDRITADSFGIDQINTSRNARWKARRVEVAIGKLEDAEKEDGGN